MKLSRRAFVRTLSFTSAGALVAPAIAARGREALMAVGVADRAPSGDIESAGGLLPIRLDSNENPHGPGDTALEAIRGAISEASRYPDLPHERLHEAVSRWQHLPVDSVVVGCGSTEILRMAVQQFTGPERPLVTATPTFEAPARFAARIGSPVVAVPLDANLRLDFDAMRAKGTEAGLIYVCNPNNPTSTTRTADDVKELVMRLTAASPRTTILIDEAYFEYVEDPACGTAIPLAMANPRVIVSRTFSKVFGLAGLRVGYAVGSAATIKELAAWKLPDGVNLLGASAAIAAMGDPANLEKARRLNREAKTYTRKFFESAGYSVVPGDANFIMVNIRRDAGLFRAACRERSVMIGRPFPPLDTHVRITIGTMDEMQRSVEVFRQILESA